MKKDQLTLGWIVLIILALIWGSSFILIKKGLIAFSPFQVGAIRVSSAGLFLLPVALSSLTQISRKNFPFLLSVGLVGSLIPAFLFAKAQTQIDSSVAGVLNALTPLFVILVGAIFFAQKTSRRVLFGVAIGFIGTIVLVMTGSAGKLDFNSYALFVVLATICYGFNVNLIKYRLAGLKALQITSLSLFLTSPFALAYLFLLTDFWSAVMINREAQIALLYLSVLGVMGTAIALVMFNRLVQITNPIFTSSVTYLIPIVALGWGLLDGESLYLGHYLGMGVILAGVFIANRR